MNAKSVDKVSESLRNQIIAVQKEITELEALFKSEKNDDRAYGIRVKISQAESKAQTLRTKWHTRQVTLMRRGYR